MKYICLIVLAPDFMTKKRRTVSKVFDRVKTVALWFAKKLINKKDHKGL